MRIESIKFNKNDCIDAVRTGKNIVKRTAEMISKQHQKKRYQKLHKLHENHIKLLESGKAKHKVFSVVDNNSDNNQCSTPMHTIYPTPPTTKTPVNGGNTPPDNGGNTPPDNGGNTPPDNGGNTPPDNGGNTPPVNGGNTPPVNGGNTPPVNGGNTPPDNGGNTPPDNGGNTPPVNGGNTPPVNGGNTPPVNGNPPIVGGNTPILVNDDDTLPVNEENAAKDDFSPNPLFINSESDPFSWMMKYLHDSLDEEEFCNGPTVKDFFDISDGQIHGTLANFLTTSGHYLCPLCHNFASHIHYGLFHKHKLSMADDERFMYESVLAHIPEPEDLCSTVIPSCHENYETKKKNLTAALDCVKCTACNSISIIVVQKIINNNNRENIKKSFRENIFSNICAEICILGQSAKNQTFNYGDEKSCLSFFDRQFDWIYSLLQRFLLPNNFCAYELGMCQLNEAPNIIHCLKLLCDEALSHPLNIICPLIPDEPDDIQRFLNIQQKPMTTESWKKAKGEL